MEDLMAEEKDYRNSDSIRENEIRQILDFARGIKYGSVTIQIVDGKITQVDKVEKIRFDKK